MNLTTDLALFANTAYPDNTTNPARKTPQWIRQRAAAGVTEFLRCVPHWQLWAADPNIGENIQYALGEQDTQQYRRFTATGKHLTHDSLEVSNRDGSFDEAGVYSPRTGSGGPTDPMGLDSIIKAVPLPILPVKLRGLKSTIVQPGYEATITALGRKADQEAREHEAELRLWMDFGDDLKQMGMAPPEGMPDPMPATEPELQTYLDDYQVAAAADLERKVQICAVESGLAQQLDEVANDLLYHGYGCLADEQLPGQRPTSERILPNRGLFLPSAYPDYRDMTQGGHIKTLTLEQLTAEIQDEKQTCNAEGKPWTKADWSRVKEMAGRTLPKSIPDPALGIREDTGGIDVVRWRFLSDDSRKWKTKQDEAGNVRTKPIKDPDYELTGKGKLTDVPVNCLYEAMLIAGTDLAYNCRKVLDQGRDLHNPLKARMPYSIYVAGLTNGRPVSMVRNAKGIVDEIERSWRGYMADMRTYVPEGYNVSMKTLQSMADAMKSGSAAGNGKADDLMEMYRFFRQTGDTFADDIDSDTNSAAGPPARKNPTGIPLSAQQHLDNLNRQLQLLEAVTGANAVVSAATPSGEQGKAVNQIALQGAANVMSFLRDGLLRLYENHVRNIAGRIWLTEKDVPVTGGVAGPDGTMKQVGPRNNLHEYGFFMDVRYGPSDEEKQELRQTAFQATQGGAAAQLNYDDYLKICWLLKGNLKTAQRYMAVAVTRKARLDEAKALSLQKANGDVQTQTAQQTAQAQQQTDAAKHQQNMELAQFQRETAWGGIERQTAAQERVAQDRNRTAVAVATIAGEDKLQADQAAAERAEVAKEGDRVHEGAKMAVQHAMNLEQQAQQPVSTS